MKKKIVSMHFRREGGKLFLHVQGDPETFRPLRGNEEFHFMDKPTWRCKVGTMGISAEFNNNNFLNPTTDRVNLQFLLCRELAEGVEFDLGERLWSENFVKELLGKMRDAVKEIYVQFLKPFSMKVNLSVEEISQV